MQPWCVEALTCSKVDEARAHESAFNRRFSTDVARGISDRPTSSFFRALFGC